MDARELRVGNNVIGFNGNIVMVTEIRHHEPSELGVEYEDLEEGGIWISQAGILPIKITNNILEQCGFIKEDDNEYYLDAWSKGHPSARFEIEFRNQTVLLKSRYQPSDDNLTMRHIKHLHQLQNLFHALTNEELIFNHEK